MKKSIEKFEVQKVNNSSAIKGGTYGSGTRKTSSQASTQAELL
jgi:hypothetical protein